MIIYDILRKEKDNLKFLGKSDKNIDLVASMITELKKHNITLQNLNNLEIEDKYTSLKMEDIKLIFRKYNEKIESSFVDENDILSICTDYISKSKIFKDSLIYIDDFIGFTPQEYKVFEELLKEAENIIISVPTDNLETLTKEQDIFYFNKIFANKL